MDTQVLKRKIENLDPKTHRALRDALAAKYNRLTGAKTTAKPRDESETFADMFRKAGDEINRRYIEGTISYVRKYQPDLYQKTKKAESKLNEVWKAGLEGKASIEQFREVLKQWYVLQLRGIEIYSKEQGK